ATVQGDLWNARARDWAELQEGLVEPLFKAVLDEAKVVKATRLLDAGCGAGHFCELAAQRGAVVAGIDAASEMIAFARERVPQGEFRVGEMEMLPYADNSFDVVTGINAFQYANTPAIALKEARRVTAEGGLVVAATWGAADCCEAAAYVDVLGSVLPPAS